MTNLRSQGVWDPVLCSCSLHHLLQVINRDLSIAVLRYFVRQRQKEIAEGVLKAPRPKRTPAEAAQLKQSAGEMQSYLSVHLRRQKHLIVPRKSPNVKGRALQYSQGMPREVSQRISMVFAEGPTPRPKLDDNIRILEGLAASGLRSIRYALEVKPYSTLMGVFNLALTPAGSSNVVWRKHTAA